MGRSLGTPFRECIARRRRKVSLRHAALRVPLWQVNKLPPGKQVKLELTCFRDRTDDTQGSEGLRECGIS